MKFSYQSEKLAEARRSLMLPHPQGEAKSIAHAFHACSLGLRDLQRDSIDDSARQWVSKIEELMDTSKVQDPTGRGRWEVKAEGLTEDQKFELSCAVDELASWFHREFWSA